VTALAAVGAGVAAGAALVFSRLLPLEWAGVVLLALLFPVFALVVGNIEKLLLIVLVLDIPLGLDIALANRAGHRGGPGGFLISLMTLALTVGLLRHPQRRPTRAVDHACRSISVPALVFLFATLVSAFVAKEVWFTLVQLFLSAQFVLMYYYLTNRVQGWVDIRVIVTSIAVCLLLESIVMLLQLYAGFRLSMGSIQTHSVGSSIRSLGSRVGGTLSGPNVAATFLVSSLAITCAASLAGSRFVSRRLAFPALLLGTVALVVTQSRAAWIAAAVVLPGIAAYALHKRIGGRMLLALVVAVLALASVFTGLVVERFVTDDRGSAESRIWYSELALNIIREHVFTGIGANNQQFALDDDAYAPQALVGQERTSIHNAYLTIWVELGPLGFLAFVWLLLAGGRLAFAAARSATAPEVAIVISGFLGALVANAMHMAVATFDNRRPQFLWLILALIAVLARLSSQKQEAGGAGDSATQVRTDRGALVNGPGRGPLNSEKEK
jgi:O-antigen ligase